MNRNVAIVLSVFAIMYFGVLIVSSIDIPLISDVEQTGETHTVELEDGIQSSETADVPHPLIGTIHISEDGSTCWKVEERIGVFYYKITECSGHV